MYGRNITLAVKIKLAKTKKKRGKKTTAVYIQKNWIAILPTYSLAELHPLDGTFDFVQHYYGSTLWHGSEMLNSTPPNYSLLHKVD